MGNETGNLMRAKLTPGHGDDGQGVYPMTQGLAGLGIKVISFRTFSYISTGKGVGL